MVRLFLVAIKFTYKNKNNIIDFMAILKTKIKSMKQEKVCRNVWGDCENASNSDMSDGRIWLGWNKMPNLCIVRVGLSKNTLGFSLPLSMGSINLSREKFYGIIVRPISLDMGQVHGVHRPWWNGASGRASKTQFVGYMILNMGIGYRPMCRYDR